MKGRRRALPRPRQCLAVAEQRNPFSYGQDVLLPDLRRCSHFVNLTNGLEALPTLCQLQLPFGFVRIQSTTCEQQRFEKLVNDLDAGLMMALALAAWCTILAAATRKEACQERCGMALSSSAML